jgi:hypothetical protein
MTLQESLVRRIAETEARNKGWKVTCASCWLGTACQIKATGAYGRSIRVQSCFLAHGMSEEGRALKCLTHLQALEIQVIKVIASQLANAKTYRAPTQ